MKKIEPKDVDDDLLCYFDQHNELPTEWQQVAFFDEETNLAIVSIDRVFGAVNEKGETIIPLIYDYAMSRFSDGLLAVKKNNKWGYVDCNHQIVIPFEYDNVIDYYLKTGDFYIEADSTLGNTGYFENNKVIVKKNGKMGMIDKQNQIIIPFEYEKIGSFSDQYLVVSTDNISFGVIDYSNKVVLPYIYDDLKTIFENQFVCFGVKTNEKIENYDRERDLLSFKDDCLLKYGIIDIDGNVVIPTIGYMPINNFRDRKAMCYDYHKDEFFVYDAQTEEHIYAPSDMEEKENSRVNYIRKLVGLEPIDF